MTLISAYVISHGVRRPIDNQIWETIDRISEKLSSIEEHMAWIIKPEQRFRVGQRVEWSRKAHKQGWMVRKNARRGTVKAIEVFSIVVKLDNYKGKPRRFHHAFFNPVSGPKLF